MGRHNATAAVAKKLRRPVRDRDPVEQPTKLARRALRLQRLKVSDREDPFAAIIRCTADAAKADKRTRSKWSRVMRYASEYKPDPNSWISSSDGRAASTRALRGSLGDWPSKSGLLAAGTEARFVVGAVFWQTCGHRWFAFVDSSDAPAAWHTPPRTLDWRPLAAARAAMASIVTWIKVPANSVA
jgi:hypothetical protein